MPALPRQPRRSHGVISADRPIRGWTDHLARTVVALGNGATFSKKRDFAHWGVGISARLCRAAHRVLGAARKPLAHLCVAIRRASRCPEPNLWRRSAETRCSQAGSNAASKFKADPKVL